jgi:protein-S-isoprenylcysteine O-methyltransferase Ste14
MTHARRTQRKALVRFVGFALATAVSLFGPAGTLRWWNAWVFLGVSILLIGTLMLSVFRSTPGLLEERMSARAEAKGWDKALVPALAGLPFVVNTLAGFDHRLSCTKGIATWGPFAALGPLLAGIALTHWAMKSNRFFSSHVRLQRDRKQVVVSVGPYARVRHPGYAGAILYNLAVPFLLGSVVALPASAVMVALLVLRTWLEDRTLGQELPGYGDYAGRVRYRLVPRVW